MKDIETTVRNLYHIIVRGDTIFVYPLEYGDRLDAESLYEIEYPDKDYDYEWEAKYFVKWVPKDECEVTYYDVIKKCMIKKILGFLWMRNIKHIYLVLNIKTFTMKKMNYSK